MIYKAKVRAKWNNNKNNTTNKQITQQSEWTVLEIWHNKLLEQTKELEQIKIFNNNNNNNNNNTEAAC